MLFLCRSHIPFPSERLRPDFSFPIYGFVYFKHCFLDINFLLVLHLCSFVPQPLLGVSLVSCLSSLCPKSHFHSFYFIIFYILKFSSLKSFVSKSYVISDSDLHSFTGMLTSFLQSPPAALLTSLNLHAPSPAHYCADRKCRSRGLRRWEEPVLWGSGLFTSPRSGCRILCAMRGP